MAVLTNEGDYYITPPKNGSTTIHAHVVGRTVIGEQPLTREIGIHTWHVPIDAKRIIFVYRSTVERYRSIVNHWRTHHGVEHGKFLEIGLWSLFGAPQWLWWFEVCYHSNSRPVYVLDIDKVTKKENVGTVTQEEGVYPPYGWGHQDQLIKEYMKNVEFNSQI